MDDSDSEYSESSSEERECIGEIVDIELIKNDPIIKLNEEIMNLLLDITKDNIDSTIDTLINVLNLSNGILPTFTRILYRAASIRYRLIKYYVELVQKLTNMVDIVEFLRKYLFFGFSISAYDFIHALKDSKILNEDEVIKTEKRCLINRQIFFDYEPNEIIAAVKEDDVDSLQTITSTPGFDIDSMINDIFLPTRVLENKSISLIRYSALFGSVKCFKYLLLNHASIEQNSLLYSSSFTAQTYAIAGGNTEIIRLVEQQGILPIKEEIKLAIMFHHSEIVQWLIERFQVTSLDEIYLKLCIDSENFKYLDLFSTFNTYSIFEAACSASCVEIARLILENYNVQVIDSFVKACEWNRFDIVKLILDIKGDSFNVNQTVCFELII